MPMVKVRDGSSVFVRVLGRGQPVVLLHGFALDSRHWLPLVVPYLNSYRFIMPDFRGHGSSESGNIHRSRVLDTLCEDIDDVLDALGIDQAMLCAYSMGALIGLEYVLRRQMSRVERYLHIESSPRFHSSPDWEFGFNAGMMERAGALLDLWSKKDENTAACYRELIHEMVRQAFPNRWIKQMVEVLPAKWLEPMLPDPAFTFEVFSWMLESDFDVRARVPGLRIPGLIMSGRHSCYFPSGSCEWLHQNWEQSEHLVFEHSGHGLMYSEPLKFRKAFQFFLNDEIERVHEIGSSRNWLRLRPAG